LTEKRIGDVLLSIPPNEDVDHVLPILRRDTQRRQLCAQLFEPLTLSFTNLSDQTFDIMGSSNLNDLYFRDAEIKGYKIWTTPLITIGTN
jgi:hypothetical protein